MTEEKSHSVWRHPLWIAVIVGAILRLYHLGQHSLWYDESTSLLGAQFVDWKFTFLSASESRLTPLFAVLGKVWYMLGTEVFGFTMGTHAGDAYLRGLPLIFGVALIPMTYLLANYVLQHKTAAWVAAWCMALSPLQIYYAQEYRPHTLYAFLVCAGMYVSLRALDEGTRKYWITTVVIGVLAFYAYYFSAVYLVCMNIFALVNFKRYRHRVRAWTLSQLAILLLIIPPALMARTVWDTHTSAAEHWFPHPTLKTILLTLKNMYAGYSANVPLYWTLFFVGVTMLVLGVVAARKQYRALSFLLCLSIVPMLLQIGVWATQDFAFYTYRIQLAYAAPIYILMGLGVSMLRVRWVQVGVLGLFSLLTLPALMDTYNQNLHPVWNHVIGARYKVDSRSAALWVKADWQDGDVVAHLCTYSFSPFKNHYLPDAPQWVMSLREADRTELLQSYPDPKMWETIGFMPRPAQEIAQGATRIWYVESWWEYGHRTPRMQEYRLWLAARGTLVEMRDFDGVRVVLYEMR